MGLPRQPRCSGSRKTSGSCWAARCPLGVSTYERAVPTSCIGPKLSLLDSFRVPALAPPGRVEGSRSYAAAAASDPKRGAEPPIGERLHPEQGLDSRFEPSICDLWTYWKVVRREPRNAGLGTPVLQWDGARPGPSSQIHRLVQTIHEAILAPTRGHARLHSWPIRLRLQGSRSLLSQLLS